MPESPFYTASLLGDLSLVQKLSKDPGVEINWQNEQGFTPFSVACQEGFLETAKFLLGLQGLDHNLHQAQGATPFYLACQNGYREVVSLLLGDERIDVNKTQKDGVTPLLVACQKGHVDVVLLLLADKRVEVNKARDTGATPFFMACCQGHVDIVAALLADERIDINTPASDESTPLWMAAQSGHLAVVQHLLVSGREVDTKRKSSFNNKSAAEHARDLGARVKRDPKRMENCPKIADLIDSYDKDPVNVTWRLVRELRLAEANAGELFALAIYFADGYLELPVGREKSTKAGRFFSLAAQLSLDLQMVLCNRAFGLGDSIIKKGFSEPGFKRFARGF